MTVFSNGCKIPHAQGDVYIRRIKELPTNVVQVEPEGQYVIVTHSETGHHHVMEKEKVKMYSLPNSIMDCPLVVNSPTELKHLRDYDTHESIMFEPGIYQVKRQREYTPQGFRKAQD